MAGHSKWANIKRQKGINDQKKSAALAKLSRAITLAVIEGGGVGDPDLNVRLRVAIEKAKYAEMSKDTIQRAIDKGSGPGTESIREAMYEAFGPEGSAFLIRTASDNPNRTVSDLRTTLERNGGKIGSPGSVSYLFEHAGIVSFNTKTTELDVVFSFAERIGAADIVEEVNTITVYVPFAQLGKIKDSLGDLQPAQPPDEDYRALSEISLETGEAEEKVLALIDILESMEDVQTVYANIAFKHLN